MAEDNASDFFDDATTEPEPTDLENLLARIESWMELVRKSKNINHYNTLLELIEEAEQWFDDEGEPIPVETPGDELNVQFSPAEVVPVEGEETVWQNVQLEDLDMKIPNFLRKWRNRNLGAGLDISLDRSNGCFLIRNLQETAENWADESYAENLARAFNKKRLRASPRIFVLAGHMMGAENPWRFMFPTWEFKGSSGIADYAFEQGVPFNDEEKRIFRLMFKLVHSKGGFLGASQYERRLNDSFDVLVNPGEKDSSLHVPVDPLGKHRMLTVFSHPEWILPTAMAVYNTTRFKRLWYRKALALAYQIDMGNRGRVPGYLPPEHFRGGGPVDEAFRTQWRELFERHGVDDTLPFKPGRQSKLD